MSVRRSMLFVVLQIACGDSPREAPAPTSSPAKPSHLEQTIQTQLSAKLGRTCAVSCSGSRCNADLGDAVLPIAIAKGSGDVAWSVEGLLVRAAPIEAYLKAALVDLGAPQRLTCGPAIRSVAAGARIECVLEHGGKAFATIAADGSFSTEIDLDPAAAAARSTEASQVLLDRGSAAAGSAADDDD
jgi:hypothetical protein